MAAISASQVIVATLWLWLACLIIFITGPFIHDVYVVLRDTWRQRR